MSGSAPDTESFRDHIATVDSRGKRVWIYPAKPRGPLHRARLAVSWVLLAFMFSAPFIKLDGHPFLLFNIIERRFVIFGHIFWPQDFYLFVLATINFVVFIVLFTVVYGRMWCGWACPQTVFMEMVFRKLEYWIEGNSGKQRARDRAPLDADKLLRKSFKHLLFFLLSFLVGNIALAYIIGIEKLQMLMADGPGAHLGVFIAVVAFSGLTYFIFARFREQVCLIVCPYGRLQSVLLDASSIVVAYDHGRGEPRGVLEPRQSREGRGHCVDCGNCVAVCPTGIDIRNGTQLECVNCTACIDACNNVMSRVGFPKGLIRYTSHRGISSGTRLKITPRMIGYSTVLVVLLAVLSILLAGRKDLQATVLRTPGMTYEELPDGTVRNLYSFQGINKTFDAIAITLALKDLNGQISMVGGNISIPPEGMNETAFFIDVPRSALTAARSGFSVQVYGNGHLMSELKTTFLGPRVGGSRGGR
jgi:cytochrome c oxidase accessory protein FixG